jgi:hypothetical protein
MSTALRAVEPEAPDPEGAWEEELRHLAQQIDLKQWEIADHLNSADADWGEKYVVAEKITGRKRQTLKNWASVASKFETSRRRYESRHLTFGHFDAVRAKDEEQQEQLLDEAEEGKLTVAELRNRARGVSGWTARDGNETDRVVVSVPRVHYPAFVEAAGVSGTDDEMRKGVAKWLVDLGVQAIANKEVAA